MVPPSIGLALGGGAARGFAHLGVMRRLIEAGIKPDVIVGTSIGAVVGGCYAADRLEPLDKWARSLTLRGLIGNLDISFAGSGLLGGRHLTRHLTEALGRHPHREVADPFRRDRDRISQRPRNLADAGPAGRCVACVIRAARHIPAGARCRALAARRRAGQSGAGLGGTRARRPRRHCCPSQCGTARPRHRDFQFRRRGSRRAGRQRQARVARHVQHASPRCAASSSAIGTAPAFRR